jgi:hypothetical protein
MATEGHAIWAILTYSAGFLVAGGNWQCRASVAGDIRRRLTALGRGPLLLAEVRTGIVGLPGISPTLSLFAPELGVSCAVFLA